MEESFSLFTFNMLLTPLKAVEIVTLIMRLASAIN